MGVERQRAELRIGSWSACGPAEPVGAVRQARTQTHKRLKAATLFSARRQLTSRVGGSAAAMSSNIQVSLDNPYGQARSTRPRATPSRRRISSRTRRTRWAAAVAPAATGVGGGSDVTDERPPTRRDSVDRSPAKRSRVKTEAMDR
ncbi:uncharacterized protein LOC144090543 isoform X3 [Stigmatopora argus]